MVRDRQTPIIYVIPKGVALDVGRERSVRGPPTADSTDNDMDLTRTERRTLRALGWSVGRRKARRPTHVPTRDVLRFEEQIVVDDDTRNSLLTELDRRI